MTNYLTENTWEEEGLSLAFRSRRSSPLCGKHGGRRGWKPVMLIPGQSAESTQEVGLAYKL